MVILAPIIEKFESQEMKDLTEAAYPTKKPDAKPKKGKRNILKKYS